MISDIDECQSDVCSQKCENLNGTFTCSCYNGYFLDTESGVCSRKF